MHDDGGGVEVGVGVIHGLVGVAQLEHQQHPPVSFGLVGLERRGSRGRLKMLGEDLKLDRVDVVAA